MDEKAGRETCPTSACLGAELASLEQLDGARAGHGILEVGAGGAGGADPAARVRAVKVKVAAPVQPVVPAGPSGSPFVPVEFTGLTVTYYVNQAGRLAYSLKATGIRAPGRGRPGPETREVAA